MYEVIGAEKDDGEDIFEEENNDGTLLTVWTGHFWLYRPFTFDCMDRTLFTVETVQLWL